MKVFNRRDLHHLCKISGDGSVIFYSSADCIVFFTTVMIYAARYGIRITNICIMRNHFHLAVYAARWEDISVFIQQICARYVRLRNAREGKIKISFMPGISRSDKYYDKDVRNCHLYISNNPVEKKQCAGAGDFRWNFLSYQKVAPDELHVGIHASKELKRACSIVRSGKKAGFPVGYNFLELYSKLLSNEEYLKLEDYIINLYNAIDWTEILHYYGTIENFKSVAAQTRGADFDMSEEKVREVYTHYDQLQKAAERLGFEGDDIRIHKPGFELFEAVRQVAYTTDADSREIARFLHLSEGEVRDITGRRW